MNSELTAEDKEFIIDVARPDPDKLPPDDMDYKKPESELVLEHLKIVAHEGEARHIRQIMMTIEAEKFDMAGHSKLRLEEGIFRTYKDVYKNDRQALKMVEANKKTV